MARIKRSLGLGDGADSATRRLGARGERLAAQHLRRSGCTILRRNVRAAAGEIDLIARAPDGRTIVFVEVKARAASQAEGAARFAPEGAITHDKARRLVTLARTLARRYGWESLPLRIDVIAIEVPRKGKPTLRHHVDAVR